MKITDELLESALQRIFRTQAAACDNDGYLDITSLRECWTRYHLRASDLDRAIACMRAKGALKSVCSGLGSAYKPVPAKIESKDGGMFKPMLTLFRRIRSDISLDQIAALDGSADKINRGRRASDRQGDLRP